MRFPIRKATGRVESRTLVVRFGRSAGVWLYGAAGAAAFLVIIISPLLGMTTFWTYLSLLTFPLFAKACAVLRRNYRNPPAAMAPANLLTIRAHNLMGVLLIAAYVIRGAIGQRPLVQMIAPLAILFVLYLPVAVTIFFPYPRTRPGAFPIP